MGVICFDSTSWLEYLIKYIYVDWRTRSSFFFIPHTSFLFYRTMALKGCIFDNTFYWNISSKTYIFLLHKIADYTLHKKKKQTLENVKTFYRIFYMRRVFCLDIFLFVCFFYPRKCTFSIWSRGHPNIFLLAKRRQFGTCAPYVICVTSLVWSFRERAYLSDAVWQ